jgi:methyltransferase (TIGR00027 family)
MGEQTMKRNQSSLTAAGIAIVRAIESEKPAGERICYDPYARRFVSAGLFCFVDFFARLGYADWKGPGVWDFLVVRERYIDDHLEAYLSEGLEQLVILGAGYDARAYRFDALKTRARVFEVDHPATQAVKLKKLMAIFGARPAYVTYVAIDFDRERLADRLFGSGYDEQRKTLFIWQGVTQYLTPAAVDDTLAFVAGHSGPGSSIIFDYMDATLLAGAPRHGEVSNMRRYRRLSGEGLVFGIPIGSIQAFLEERGFTQVQNADHAALERAYYSGDRQRRVADGYAIVSAVVRARRQGVAQDPGGKDEHAI